MQSYLLFATRALIIIAILAISPEAAASIPDVESWRSDITYTPDSDVRTQAIVSDSEGNSYVAGVSVTETSLFRFLQKLDSSGSELWRYESPPVSIEQVYSDIPYQQLIIDEANGALYVLRSYLVSGDSNLYSIWTAKHSLSNGTRIWNKRQASENSLADPNKKTASMGVGAGGIIWVAYQRLDSIRYITLDNTSGDQLEQGLLAISQLTGTTIKYKTLLDMVVNQDRLFLAYQEGGSTSIDLVVSAFDISTGSPTIVNPHEPTPCSTTTPCRQEFNFNIPESINRPVIFTDGALDASGNFVVVGYYEYMEAIECLPDCNHNEFWYYPVVVKVDRSNHVIFQTIEQGPTGTRLYGGTTDNHITASVTGWADDSILLLLARRAESGVHFSDGSMLMELDAYGARTDSRNLHSYYSENFSGGGCNRWYPIWQPRALTTRADRVVITGQFPAICETLLPKAFDTSRTVSFAKKFDVSLSFNQSSVNAGDRVYGIVTVNNPAPSGGYLLSLQSSNPGVASVPSSLLIPAGADSRRFMVSTNADICSTSVEISVVNAITSLSESLYIESDYTTPPTQPTGFKKYVLLKPSKFGGEFLSLSWDSMSNVENFVIDRQINNLTWKMLDEVPAGQTAFIPPSQTPCIRYRYRLRAMNHCGRSAPVYVGHLYDDGSCPF
jgi:hypothetical protein